MIPIAEGDLARPISQIYEKREQLLFWLAVIICTID